MNSGPGSLAFDFDGVLCNGLREYFQTSWRVYRQTWPVSNTEPPEGLASRFNRLRPVVEVGWEMPVVLRAVIQGFSDADILSRWPHIRQQLVQSEDLSIESIGQLVDATRDHCILHELDDWLDLHEFYPGVIQQLQQLQQNNIPFVIVTTKESRFVHRLLGRAGIVLGNDQIFGKDCKRPKPKTLRLLKTSLPLPIWFIEDRIAALKAVQAESDLQDIQLFLADWGYNIARDRKEADQSDAMTCLSLGKFQQSLADWVS
ncbi:MAG: HAD family hydrolase [Cyanobacteria bacterium P01_F01_bin.42]